MSKKNGNKGNGNNNTVVRSGFQVKAGPKKPGFKKHGNPTPVAGSDLFAQIQQDKLTVIREPRPSTPLLPRFRNLLGIKLLELSKQKGWGEKTGRLAAAYADALVNGDGMIPAGLGRPEIELIRWRFAWLNATMKEVHPGMMPGQDQDWFFPTLTRVYEVLDRRRERISA